MENATVVPRLPLSEGEIFFPSPMMVMPARPGTPGSVRLTSSVSLTSRLPHDLTRLSATSLITLQLAERVPLRTFYDGLFRFPCHYGIQLYRKAAEIFDRLHEYQPGSKCNLFVENIEFSCNEEKKLAFELAYAAMKYEEVLRQTLDDVGFVVKYPEFQDELSLASVILYDYQDRRFQRRQALPSDRQHPRHCQLEEALFHLRTRLSAALARIRILHDAPTLQTLLPAEVHPPEPARHRPVHAWINCNKASSQQILDSLGSTLKILQPGLTESSFHYDDDFPDLLVFESGWKKTLEKTATFKKHWIVLQEKACCLPAYATAQELRRLRQREPELRGSVLQVGAGSGRSLAHLLSLLPDRDNISRLLAMSGDRKAVVERQLQELGVPDARVMSGGLETHGRAAELRDVMAVLVTPVTTHTALADPVDWVMEEGGDIALLRELSMDPTKSALPQRVSALVTSQNETLLRALRLPNVRVVVYATHSSNRAENEEVVFGVVDEVNEEQRRRWQEAREHGKLEIETPPDKLYEFRQLVNIPEEDIAIPFLVLPQTPTSSGVFIAVIVKNVDFIQRANRAVINDAIDMGMLDKVGPPLAGGGRPCEAQAGRRRSRRPKAATRSERQLAGRRRDLPLPVPAVLTPATVPMHMQVPHLADCSCTECGRQRRRRRDRAAAQGPAERRGRPGRAGRGSPETGSPRAGSVTPSPRHRTWFPSIGVGVGADSSAASQGSVSSLQASLASPLAAPADDRPRWIPTVVQLHAPAAAAAAPGPPGWRDGSRLSPIPGSGGPRGPREAERARRAEQEAVGRLQAATDSVSREAIRVIQQQMERSHGHGGRSGAGRYGTFTGGLTGGIVYETALSDSDGGGSSVGGGGIVQGVIFSSGSGAPSRAGSSSGGTYHTDTVRDLRELERVRQDAQVWWSRQAGRRSVMSPRSAGLRPHVRQLLASRGRAAARFGAAEPAVAVTGAGRRRRQTSQPPEPSEHGDTEPSPLSLPKLASRTRHLSLGPPLNIHKVNIGDFSSVAVHIPPVF